MTVKSSSQGPCGPKKVIAGGKIREKEGKRGVRLVAAGKGKRMKRRKTHTLQGFRTLTQIRKYELLVLYNHLRPQRPPCKFKQTHRKIIVKPPLSCVQHYRLAAAAALVCTKINSKVKISEGAGRGGVADPIPGPRALCIECIVVLLPLLLLLLMLVWLLCCFYRTGGGWRDRYYPCPPCRAERSPDLICPRHGIPAFGDELRLVCYFGVGQEREGVDP